MKTIRVSNISLVVSEVDIREFFSISGDIQYVEMKMESEKTQLAYVTFKYSNAADMAVLLSGATIADRSVTITYADENYLLPPEALASTQEEKSGVKNSSIKKAEEVVSTMVAKGFILGKDAVNKAKAFDEQHHIISKASSTFASIEHKMGIKEKLDIGTSMVNEKAKEMDERYRVSEKAKYAFEVAEKKAENARSAFMSNQYVLAGASWVTNAFSVVTKAAEDVSMMTKQKVERTEEEKKEIGLYKDKTEMKIHNFADNNLDGYSSEGDQSAVLAVNSADDVNKYI